MQRFVVLAVVGAVLWASAGAVSGAEPRQLCLGEPVTIDMGDLASGEPAVGTPERDVILGTDGDDRIIARGGDDVICAEGGDDRIQGGPGDDEIDAGGGADVARGGPGDDVIHGGPGDDPTLNGGNGNDEVYGEAGADGVFGWVGDDRLLEGGDGDDLVVGGSGADVLVGGSGVDRLRGGAGNDTLDAGDGDDFAYGGGGADRVSGGPGDDIIEGNPGNDELRGGDDADLLKGGDGADELFGEAGDDVLVGGEGDDTLVGGDGDDTLNGVPGVDSDDGGVGIDACHTGDDTRFACEYKGGCLPGYEDEEALLDTSGPGEPFLAAGDFDGDGDDDFVLTRMDFQTYGEYPLEVYRHDGGVLVEATPGIFTGRIPTVQHPRQRVVADFNGDGADDLFVADHGYDAPPFPGYQNALALSAPGGRLVDGTPGVPQQIDYTHSAAAADVDGDGDVDLYVGNSGGNVGPQIWLNDGSGRFTVGAGLLPAGQVDLFQNTYTAAGFIDVDGDSDPDLILGQGDPGKDSHVLLNDGAGAFTLSQEQLPKRESDTYALDIVGADVDLDGDRDVLISYDESATGGSRLQLLRNDGDGVFTDITDAALEPLSRVAWLWRNGFVDIDRDGDPDLLAYPFDWRDPDPILWENQGGRFTLAPFSVGLWLIYLQMTDWDGDGGRDFVQSSFSVFRERGCSWADALSIPTRRTTVTEPAD